VLIALDHSSEVTNQPGEMINFGLGQALESCKTDCDVFKNGLEQ